MNKKLLLALLLALLSAFCLAGCVDDLDDGPDLEVSQVPDDPWSAAIDLSFNVTDEANTPWTVTVADESIISVADGGVKGGSHAFTVTGKADGTAQATFLHEVTSDKTVSTEKTVYTFEVKGGKVRTVESFTTRNSRTSK